jgi:type IV pilus assembly protein PilW
MKMNGFTLVEWLIAMVMALFLLAGIFTIFVASRSTTDDFFAQSELQENGRIAMQLLSHDIKWAGFFADYTGLPLQVGPSLSSSASLSSGDCVDERAIGSLPSSAGIGRSLWVSRVSATKTSSGFACIPVADRIADSDIISIKRLVGRAIPVSEALDANRFYLATTTAEARLIKGSDSRPLFGANNQSRLWEYQHYVYYAAINTGIPVLRKRYLTVNGGSFLIGGAMAEGIERVIMLYGVDDSAVTDGIIDRYINAASMTEQLWDEGRVIGVRLFILVRASQPSAHYINNNSYQLGDVSVTGHGDGFRRLLLESSITLRNPLVIARGGS